MDAELEKLADIYVQELVRLEKYLEGGASIRIWYSDAPYSRCGFYSLRKMLQKYDNDIYSVKLPEYKVHTDSILLYQNWGEISAEEFASFLPYEKKCPKRKLECMQFSGAAL